MAAVGDQERFQFEVNFLAVEAHKLLLQQGSLVAFQFTLLKSFFQLLLRIGMSETGQGLFENLFRACSSQQVGSGSIHESDVTLLDQRDSDWTECQELAVEFGALVQRSLGLQFVPFDFAFL